jgi:hypothetical protein
MTENILWSLIKPFLTFIDVDVFFLQTFSMFTAWVTLMFCQYILVYSYGDITIASDLRTAKFRPMLGAQGIWAGRDLYRATPAVTRGLGFSSLIRRTAPFSRLLWHSRGYRGPILTRILMGPMGRGGLELI